MSSLAAQQAALVAALTSGGPLPPGIDPARFEAARLALLRKRAGSVARHWPVLAAELGAGWVPMFSAWAASRPSQGSLRDGWDFARSLRDVPPVAARELAVREVTLRYDGTAHPQPRRGSALRFTAGVIAVQFRGSVRVIDAPWTRGRIKAWIWGWLNGFTC